MKKNSGLTLVEMMVSVLLFSLLSMILALIFQSGTRTYIRISNVASAVEKYSRSIMGAGALRGILWEIRVSPSAVAIQPDSLSLLGETGTTVQFYLSGQTLMRSEDGNAGKIATDVKNLSFNYYYINASSNLVTAASAQQVKLIHVNLVMRSKNNSEVSFPSSAYLRNR